MRLQTLTKSGVNRVTKDRTHGLVLVILETPKAD